MIRFFEKGLRKVWTRIKFLSLELIIVLFAFFAALAVFIFIARMIFLKKRDDFDIAVFNFLEKHVSDVNTGLMQFFSFLGSHYFLIPANLLLVVYFLLIKKQPWFSIKVPVISLSSLLLMFILKQFFHRERPLIPLLEEARGLSFPSGHALMSSTFYGLLIYISLKGLENRVAQYSVFISFFLLILIIGLSRIYLRVHYASDVIAGFCLGLVWLVLSLSVLNKVERLSTKEIQTSEEKRL
jgi:undecaprenyl-diphosphatase